MKRLLLIIFSLSVVLEAYSQKVELPLKDSLIVYEQTVVLDTTYSQNLLQKAAKTWFVNTFKNSKQLIQSEDLVNGRIIGKGAISITAPLQVSQYLGSYCFFTIQVDIKHGKYRCRIYDFRGKGSDILNAPIDVNVSGVYCSYLNDEYKGALLYPSEKLYSKFDSTFIQLDSKLKGLLLSLNNSLVNSKNDDFE